MKRYSRLKMYFIFEICLLIWNVFFFSYQSKVYKAFGVPISISDSLGILLENEIFIITIIPLSIFVIYNDVIRKSKLMQIVIRYKNRNILFIFQFIQVCKVTLIISVMIIINTLGIGNVLGFSVYNWDSENSLFYMIVRHTTNTSIIIILLLAIILSMLQMIFFSMIIVISFWIIRKKGIAFLPLIVTMMIEVQGLGIFSLESGIFSLFLKDGIGWHLIIKMIVILIMLFFIGMLLFSQKEFYSEQ